MTVMYWLISLRFWRYIMIFTGNLSYFLQIFHCTELLIIWNIPKLFGCFLIFVATWHQKYNKRNKQQFRYFFLCVNLIVNVHRNMYQACKVWETKYLQNFDRKSKRQESTMLQFRAPRIWIRGSGINFSNSRQKSVAVLSEIGNNISRPWRMRTFLAS